MRTTVKDYEQLIKYIKQLYDDGLTIFEIIEKTNKSDTTIYRILKKLNIKIDRRTKKYNFNENYFENIDSPNKAYWLGFLFADGTISRKNSVVIGLQIQDINHLEKFAKDIDYKYPIKTLKMKSSVYKGHIIKETDACLLYLCSKKMKKDLILLGFTENKTQYPNTINFPDIYAIDFLRGFYDGDGGLFFKDKTLKYNYIQAQITFIAHKKIIPFLNNYFKNIFKEVAFSIYDTKQTDYMGYLKVQGYKKCKYILDIFYKNASVYLERKYKKYIDLLNSINTHKINLQHNNHTSIFTGVSYIKKINKYTATIGYRGKCIYLGVYENELDAAIAYNKKAIEIHGSLAIINVI